VPRLRAALVVSSGLSFAASVGSRSGGGFRETSALALAGWRSQWEAGSWSAWGGVEGGTGMVVQSVSPTAYSGVLAAGVMVGVARDVSPGVAFALEATLDGELLKRNGKTAVIASPVGWFGVVFRP
jgi:hypothetical protein